MSFFGFTRGTQIITCNSQITESNIDMNGEVITSHGTPVNGTDVVNKDYVDSVTGGTGIPETTITLTGTAYTTALSTLSGTLIVLVKNIVTNGPTAIFLMSKAESTREPNINTYVNSPGLTTEERLQVRWDPSTFIEIRKTDINYDGQYKIKYILLV